MELNATGMKVFDRAVSVTIVLLSIIQLAQAETVLITGANRGVGLEFSKQYAAKGWTVIATHRRIETPDSLNEMLSAFPDTVIVERMDVTDLAMIDAVAKKYRGQPIDILINNAAIVGALSYTQQQIFGQLDHDLFDVFMRTNVRGPLKISEAFLKNVKSSTLKRIVMVSSLAGSISSGPGKRPGRIYYKTSKAALNMVTTTIATATKDDGIIVVALHPGGVKVEKLKEFDLPGFIEPEESIAGMIRVIANLTPAQSGAFLDYTGKTLPW
jgi:NAD(P)-dependent dehydrogenase (short-subunit alcohol dehydrogenase family)